jgi:hypothetical protein
MRARPLLVALLGLAIAVPGAMPVARAADRPIVGTNKFAAPAEPAPDGGSRKRFLKSEPGRAPRLSPKPEGVGPILAPLTLKGHRDSPPTTARPLKPDRRLPRPSE